MTPPYFVEIRTEPREAGPDRYGAGCSVVLVGAPSRAEAEEWAERYAREMLLDRDPEQRLTLLKMRPVRDTLFTHEGVELIDWATFPEEAESDFDEHPWDFGSSGFFEWKTGQPERPPLEKGWEIEAIEKGKAMPDTKDFNWDEDKQFYFLIYGAGEAFVTRSLNFSTAIIPFLKYWENTGSGDGRFGFTVWPGVKRFGA